MTILTASLSRATFVQAVLRAIAFVGLLFVERVSPVQVALLALPLCSLHAQRPLSDDEQATMHVFIASKPPQESRK